MANKKGMLLASETVKIVLALIGISFLVYVLFAIYFSGVYDEEKAQADATMERIGEIIDRLNALSSGVEEVNEVTPAGWYFFSYVGNSKKPNQCVNDNCLCLCDPASDILFWEDQLEECSTSGKCLGVDNLQGFEEFEVRGSPDFTTIEIIKSDRGIEVRQK